MNREPNPRSSSTPTAPPELSLSGYLPTARPAKPAAVPAPPGHPAAIAGALDRLEELIDRENRALAAGEACDHADLNRRKSQSLLEVTRLARALPPGGNAGLGARLDRLRDKLTDNHRILGLHVAAVREIADLMVQSLAEAESDGTYGLARSQRKPQR